MKVSPSLLSANFANLTPDIEMINASEADYLHLDIMDGVFVPNISFGFPVMDAVAKMCTKPLDVHLMIENPEKYAADFIKAGADILCFHLEACRDVPALISEIKRLGAKPAVAIKPSTPVQSVFPYLNDLFMVLVMTVEPGFGGQGMIYECLPKITRLQEEIHKTGVSCIVEADGGINEKTLPDAAKCGVDLAVMGTAIFGAEDRRAFIESAKMQA